VRHGNGDPFDPSAVIHYKFFNPTDDFYGMSPLQAAIRAWQTENIAQDWNYALLNNAGRTSGALIAPTTVSDDVYLRLKDEIKDSYTGAGECRHTDVPRRRHEVGTDGPDADGIGFPGRPA
jgi:phage portal protein BeeE